ncbi:MAG TPA: flagellar brake protein [Telluria sp.]|nr:flagellar brake protein [Telluria sp.]
MSNSDLDNWHDYRVESRREIVALLRQIGEKRQLVRMLVNGEADVCVTSVLDVDPDNDLLVLDRSIDRAQNRRILEANKINCETALDRIRILFTIENMQELEYDGDRSIGCDIPTRMIRLQRREFYRMETPVTNPIKVTLTLPEELGGGTAQLPMSDISCGGIAIQDPKLQLGGEETVGKTFVGCRFDLPDIGPVTTSLQVRNMQDITLLNNKTSRRLGCMFVDISRGNMANVQRYITKLERERNARMAGLG